MNDFVAPIDKIPRSKNKNKRLFAKELRSKKTASEDIFARMFQSWKSKGLIDNVSMRSQRVIGPYIVDFLINDFKVCIEVDGKYHNKNGNYDYDRDKYIYEHTGYRVFRFTNDYVEKNSESLRLRLLKIFQYFKENGCFPPPKYSSYVSKIRD